MGGKRTASGRERTAVMSIWKSVVRRAVRFGLQRADAEDVAQIALLRLTMGEGPPEPRALEAWAHRVAFNGARDLLRTRKSRGLREAQWLDQAEIAAEASEYSLSQLVARQIAELPDSLREALSVCVVEGLSHQAAAARLRIPLGTVKSRVRRALVLLRGEASPGRSAANRLEP